MFSYIASVISLSHNVRGISISFRTNTMSIKFIYSIFLYIVYKSFSQETNSFPNPQRALNIFSSNKSPFNYPCGMFFFSSFISASHVYVYIQCILWAFLLHTSPTSVLVTIKKRFSNIRDVISFVQLPIQPQQRANCCFQGIKNILLCGTEEKWMDKKITKTSKTCKKNP